MFGRRAIVDLPTLVIAVAALGMFVLARKLPEPVVILAAGGVGVVMRTS